MQRLPKVVRRDFGRDYHRQRLLIVSNDSSYLTQLRNSDIVTSEAVP